MARRFKAVLPGTCCCLAIVIVTAAAPVKADTVANPLQSAYWRFEEGPAFSDVNFAAVGPVKDSINTNHMDAFNATTTPTYTNSVAPTPLKSGLSNTLALDFIPHEGGGDDLFTEFGGAGTPINNGIIAPGGGFTVEAAFNTNEPGRFAAIIAKEGQPGGNRPQPTFVLKTRGDDSKLQVEQWDGNGNLVQVSSLAALTASHWYYAAVVNNGSTLSLYLNSNDGMGYQLQGSVAVTGALYQAVPANPSWDNSWTIGRGQYAGQPADWFDGIIDEVRLSNAPLSSSQFLFASAATLSGDYNGDGKVDAADYVVWRNDPAGHGGAAGYNVWRANFGSMASSGSVTSAAVPEPGVFCLYLMAAAGGAATRRLRRPITRRPADTSASACLTESGNSIRGERTVNRKQSSLRTTLLLVFVGCWFSAAVADTPPNPLESAYWRFEEGPALSDVNYMVADPVLDQTGNGNHLDAFAADTAPTYTNQVPPKPLKSGLSNTLALDFVPHAGGGDDLFTLYSNGDDGKGLAKDINDGIIAPGGGFTVEAAFNTNNPARYAAIVGKEGRPTGSRPVQTFVIKTRADNSRLQVELYDGNGTERQVSSNPAIAPIVAGQWYYVAAVDTGSMLSLYIDAGSGYQLHGSIPINGALFQGVPANPLWDSPWTVGRGQFAGQPTDWFDGIIDEVRLTNSALTPSQFLFAPAGAAAAVPEPGSLALAFLAIGWGATRRGRKKIAWSY